MDAAIADGIANGKTEPLPWPDTLDLPGVCTIELEDDEEPVEEEPEEDD